MDNVMQVKKDNLHHEAIVVKFGVQYFVRTIT